MPRVPQGTVPSPALLAAQQAEAKVSRCLQEKHHFLLEAGAGAGKTYSLVEALKQPSQNRAPCTS
jgi:DNA helicase-2/ATP-dependent DNA helicase PcrA